MATAKIRDRSEEEVFLAINERRASVYRFFSNSEHADSMCAGRLMVSTLEKCRGYEDPRQGDIGEGELTYLMSGTGSSSDESFVAMAARAGIDISTGCSNVIIRNVRSTQRISDGFVICTTVRYAPEHMTETYGQHCVEIFDVPLFVSLLDNEIRRLGFQLRHGRHGLVRYANREFTGLGSPPGEIGFVKPKDRYSDDKEYRILWATDDKVDLKPTLIDVPSLSYACRRIR